MTLDLNELERLANACFVGPWKANTWEVECPDLYIDGGCGDTHDVETLTAPKEYPQDEECPQVITQIDSTHGGKIEIVGLERFAKPHAAFIAAARTAVPELIARVRELEAENKKLRSDSQNEAYRLVAENAVRVGNIRVVNSSDANRVDALFEDKENLRRYLVTLIEAIADVEDDDMDRDVSVSRAGDVAREARECIEKMVRP